ncbi:presqualene diphosphate synthase HpnD [Roseospira marina]|uniref:Presqualene diphosphate synthase HpnD n=1 Tax=Roseospira marina TaxID=140057 RepID=A0A5M6IFL0_9PROT|nr:presqualene diphosphate synthase HpnD [Roseospira marina]KAA5606515.1 presqualene diphosphate synthase HpnD [Roseospira marina]MBB4314062.1 phytoene synthase [Roseospira marina]MBB5087223.1 phytoene synthase [Roseospira marina]
MTVRPIDRAADSGAPAAPAVVRPVLDDDARETATRIMAASGTSFGGAMRLLPAERRHGMFAVYAFCRVVDDIADEPAPLDEKRARLADWRVRVALICDGRPRADEPLDRALAWVVSRFGCQEADFLAVLDGMDTDAEARVRLPDLPSLMRYCDQVACAVGRLSNPVFGIAPADSAPLASAVGGALQLTNILRDVAEDAERDRVYLPADRLAAHGLALHAHAPATAILDHPAVPAVRAELAALAAARFAEADALFARLPRGPARPARVMKEVYHALFRRLSAQGWDAVRHPPRVPKAVKAWLALRHGVL